MNILYVSHTHPPREGLNKNIGGMQRVSFQLKRQLGNMQSVSVINEVVNVSSDFNRLQTICFLLKNLISLPLKAQKTSADLVLFSSLTTAVIASYIQGRLSIPMVTICHGRDVVLPNKAYQYALEKAFNYIQGVIAVSTATRKECIQRGADADKISVLPNGIPIKKSKNLPPKSESKDIIENIFGIQVSDKKVLLTVGRFVKRKGHEWFIRNVMPRLSDQVVYITVGNGPEFANIKEAADASSCSERIFLLGRQPDEVLQQAYAAADLFVMPNIPVAGDMEGFGIVLLEANMAKTSAVAADLEGIKDVIAQGKNGYRVPALDAKQFAQKVKDILGNELKQFSKQSRTYVMEHFGWTKVAQRYADFLIDTLDRYNS